MNDIDPEEDQWVSMLFGLVSNIFEMALIASDTPADDHQMINSAKMEMRLVLDEILQMKTEDRTRENVRKSVIGMVDRLGEKYPIVDREAMEGVADSFYDLFRTMQGDNLDSEEFNY